MNWHDGYMGFGGGFMWLFWILLIVMVVVLIKWLTGTSSGSDHSGPVETPLDILKKRYANGEIDRQEFEQKKRDIQA